jgi:hypothetical protein
MPTDAPQSPGMDFPITLDSGLVVEEMVSYSGTFYEDSSDEKVHDVAALMLYNPQKQMVRFGAVALEQDGKQILVERPLTSRYKGLINIQYAVQRWVFDVTAQMNGPVRLPELKGNMDAAVNNPSLSPVYPMYFAQVSYKISTLTLYAGCENIAGYLQGVNGGNKPIVDGDKPYNPGFNSSMVWGPLMGRKFYIGLRLNIY